VAVTSRNAFHADFRVAPILRLLTRPGGEVCSNPGQPFLLYTLASWLFTLSEIYTRALAVLPLLLLFAAPGRAADTPDPLPSVVVSGTEAELHIRPPLNLTLLSFLSGHSEICTSFTVSARKEPVPKVVVTSAGFGAATFADPAAPAARQTAWTLQNVTAKGSALRLCLSPDLAPNAGDSDAGKVLVVAPDQKPVEMPIKLERPASDPPSSALLWFIALVIPAILTYWIARLTGYQTERNKQLGRFRKYKDLSYPALQDFFTAHYATLCEPARKDRSDKSQKKFAMDLEEALRAQRIWSRIPDKERKVLVKLLRPDKPSHEKIGRFFAREFPEWKDKIKRPGG
jgi:hypothetical protein